MFSDLRDNEDKRKCSACLRGKSVNRRKDFIGAGGNSNHADGGSYREQRHANRANRLMSPKQANGAPA